MAERPRISTIAIVWNDLGFSHVVTDDPELVVISIDENPAAGDDRVFLMQDGVKHVSESEMWDLIGDSPIGVKGDRGNVEEAIAAIMARRPDGKPDLQIVEKDDGGK